MEKKVIKPRTLPGFMELLPNYQIEFNRIMDVIKKNYEGAGFVPLDTPAIEDAEILLAKAGGETEKQIYRINKGDNELVLRFDLTVPLAKYVALHMGELTFPFRRYQIGKVYRGEKPQKGRFREFYQADIDIIGDGELNIINDAELPAIIANIFRELNFGEFTIKINNRKLLNGFFEHLDLERDITNILRIIDKIEKISRAELLKEFELIGIEKQKVDKILEFIEIKGENDEVLSKLSDLKIDNETFKKGYEEIKEVVKYIRLFDVPEEMFLVDLTIARGLDYYTGTVYETFLNDHRELGSICSGGRYDNLAENYTKKSLPGVGISIGLSRLFDQLACLGIIKPEKSTTLLVLVVPMIEGDAYAVNVLNNLKKNGISSSIIYDKKGLKQNLNYANKLEVPYVIIIGEDEIKENTVTLKNMASGNQKSLPLEDAISYIKENI